MDPNANLEEQLKLARRMQACVDSDGADHEGCVACGNDGERLSELVTALHEWITRGGFLPSAWKR